MGLQTDEVRRYMDIMKEQGAYGAGMSSFGPAVYAVAAEPGEVKKAVAEFLDSTIGAGFRYWGKEYRGGNCG